MALSVPPAVNYQSPLIAVPTRWDQAPVEGSKIIPCEIDWGTMGGTSNCVSFNLQNNATLNFSQIVALSIDNSACGSDIEFIFPDTSETLSIPAYAPKTICPVFTNQTQFWLSSPNAQSEDITRFSILNSLPPPIAVPTTQEQNTVSINDVIVEPAGSQQLIALGINGTIENIDVFGSMSGTNPWSFAFQLKDGNANVVASGSTQGGGSALFNGTMLNMQDIHVRFQNGLQLVWTETQLTATSNVAVNIYYRTP